MIPIMGPSLHARWYSWVNLLWVGGTQVVTQRQLANFDLEQALQQVQRRGQRLAKDSGT